MLRAFIVSPRRLLKNSRRMGLVVRSFTFAVRCSAELGLRRTLKTTRKVKEPRSITVKAPFHGCIQNARSRAAKVIELPNQFSTSC